MMREEGDTKEVSIAVLSLCVLDACVACGFELAEANRARLTERTTTQVSTIFTLEREEEYIEGTSLSTLLEQR